MHFHPAMAAADAVIALTVCWIAAHTAWTFASPLHAMFAIAVLAVLLQTVRLIGYTQKEN